MKKVLLAVLFMCLIAVPVKAEEAVIDHKDHGKDNPLSVEVHDKTSEYREKFDYGTHANFEYGVKEWLTLDSHNSYFRKSDEFRSTVGFTLKFGKK